MISEGGMIVLAVAAPVSELLADILDGLKANCARSGNGFLLQIASVSDRMMSVPSRRKSSTNSMRFTL